jgi:DNA-binding Lrp family transcriptional regulator
MAKFDLLIDCLKFPRKMIKQREVADSNPSRARKALVESGVLQASFPNFFQMGFQSQAFVDIELDNLADQDKVTNDLHEVPGIIMIYTVFGGVDMRCKVVGRNLKAVEAVSMAIRKVDGIQKATTSILVDEMDAEKMRLNWATLLEANRDHIDLTTTEDV